MGLNFKVQVFDVAEIYPNHLAMHEIPVFLAEMKAKPFDGLLNAKDVVITADTIVSLYGEVITKPANREEAIGMLCKLSGQVHQVITGICLKSSGKQKTFYDISSVTFRDLKLSEIEYYVDHYQPYDKAGAYGIQEWIGFIGITGIAGSCFNVMGLPVHRLYEELEIF